MATLQVPSVVEPAPARGRSPVQDVDTRRAAARSRSRFQEGSMSDRISAAPPSHFLGPEDETSPAFASPSSPSNYNALCPTPTTTTYASSVFRRGVSRSRSDESCDRHRRPISAAGDTLSDRSMRSGFSGASSRSFFGRPLLDSLKGMLAGKTPSQHFREPQPYSPGLQEHQVPQSPPPAPQPRQFLSPPPQTYRHDDRPSREEIMKGYKELMASDFFASRAITSTRQPPPGVGMRFPPPAPSSGAASSTSIHSAAPRSPPPQTPPQQPQPFPAELLATLNNAAPAATPRPRPRPRGERPARPISAIIPSWVMTPRASIDIGSHGGAPGRHSVDGYASNRGVKRPRFAVRNGVVVELDDNDDGAADDPTETDVGRAIKRLRKSASRLSVELSIPRLRRSHNTSDSSLSSSSSSTPTDSKPRKHHRLAKLVIGARFSSKNSGTPVTATPSTATPTYPLSAPSPFVARGPASSSSLAQGAGSSLAPPRSRWATPRTSMDPLCVVPDANRGIPTVPEIPEHLFRARPDRLCVPTEARRPSTSISMSPSARSRTDENMCYVRTSINMEDVMML